MAFVKFIFIAAFIILFFVTVIMLKPLSKHRKYPYTTFALKFSFLFYMVFALAMTYFFLFDYASTVAFFEDIENPRASFHFTILLFTLFIPAVGILLRRKFTKRKVYNLIFTGVNFSCILYYVFLAKIVFRIAF